MISIYLSIYLSIYISMYGIYIAPLQGNYSEAFLAHALVTMKVLSRENELDK